MYTTQTLVQSYLGRDFTSREARLWPVLSSAVDKWINKVTGRNFEPVEESRIFDTGYYNYDVFIDPIIDIDSVEYLNADGSVNTTYDATIPDYVAYPLNSYSKTSLRRIGAYWPHGSGRIKITGKWGERDGVPADIQLAATILCSDWLSSEDKLKSESIEGYSRTFQDSQDSNPQVDQILSGHKRVLL